ETKRTPEPKQPPAAFQGPMVAKVRPGYPKWFDPAARFVEQRPRIALIALILTLISTFGAGLFLGLVLK
ncbi:MAG: serine/threonine protein kinase, partial [Isosphaerales bacterium]